MSSTIKNIIILVVVAIALILAYVFFLKPAPEEAALTSATGIPLDAGIVGTNGAVSPVIESNFLSVLLNVRNIKLDDAIFSDSAFGTLRDSSIELISEGNEGRPNPFAPIGSDVTTAPINQQNLTTQTTNTTSTTYPTIQNLNP